LKHCLFIVGDHVLMRLMRPALLSRPIPLEYGRGLATPDQARRALGRTLKRSRRHAARAARAGHEVSELAVIGQTRSGADYSAQRRYWQRRARGWGVSGWPERLPSGRYALFLAPVAVEAAAVARAHPKPELMPSFINFEQVLPAETALAIIVSFWLTKVAPDHLHAVALTPPILERYTHGRLQRRDLVDFGLDWPLPPPQFEGHASSASR